MNLDIVEQRCLAFLQQTASPSVLLSRLVSHLRQFEDYSDVDATELLVFLRGHDLFKVFEPLPIPPSVAERLGISTDPRVVLATREPTPLESCAIMKETLENMAQALETAIRDADQRGDSVLHDKAVVLLRRVIDLRDKFAPPE